MKKTLLLLTFAAFLSCKDSAVSKLDEQKLVETAKANAFPKIAFDNLVHDFGTIPMGEKAETVFRFKNEGEADLVIIDAKASCGCTAPDYTKTPIKPNEYGEVKVAFSPTSEGIQEKTVTLSTNTEKGSEVVTIKANVTPKN
jgi:hypothetical protein